MFTGIIETMGTAVALRPKGRVWELQICPQKKWHGLRIGQSVSVNGVCLTIVSISPSGLAFEIQKETLRCTALGKLSAGNAVNLERALPASGRLDGHFVQGHVDGVGTAQFLARRGKDVILKIRFPQNLSPFIVHKGSIAVDGVSLTAVNVNRNAFTAHLIPHTLEETTLGRRKIGDPLNLEVDIIGKYVYWNLQRRKNND